MLRWFDADKSGEVSLDEFMDGLEVNAQAHSNIDACS